MSSPSNETVDEIDLYALLNIDRCAAYEDVQKAYKLLSKTFHPDRLRSAQDKQDAQKTFLLVKQAHDTLSDPMLRLAYDHAGIQAVTLVKRSQQRHQREDDRPPNDHANDDDDDDDDSQAEVDLYRSMQKASKEQAVLILQEALDEFLQEKQAASPHFDASLDVPIQLHEGLQPERDTTSIHFHCRRQPTPHIQATVGATSQIQRTAETDIQLSTSVSYQPAPGSQVQVDAAMNHKQPAPQLSFRSQRQFSSGTVASVVVGGSTQSLKSWTYSMSSSRNVQWRHGSNNNHNPNAQDEEEPPTKLQAFWRMSLASTGRSQFALASIRTMQFPQWRVRLSSSVLPLKISYQTDPKGSIYIAWSTAGMWSRIKVTMVASMGRWKLRYGVKYDGGSIQTGGMPWTVVCKLQSNDWTIRFPFGLSDPSSWPVVWASTLMVSMWVDSQLEKWIIANGKKSTTMPVLNDPSSSLSNSLPYADMMGRIAAKKRLYESSLNGLVILHAVYQESEDVTDFLQYWVVESRLYLLVREMYWWRRGDEKEESIASWMWRKLTRRSLTLEPTDPSSGARPLVVRYRYGCSVFEIVFEDDELIWLPNDRAKELGSASLVT